MLDFALDKKLWENVRVSPDFALHRKEINELYEKSFKVAPRPHSAREIFENNDNGLWRLQFDQIQSSALMALIYPDNEEYYNNLVDTLWALLNEYSWAPIGHFSPYYYGKTAADFDCGLIDIFAASHAFALAEIKNLFKDRFPALLTDRITYEIRRRAIEPYLKKKFFWETHDNNWTAVCTGSIGAVLMYEAPELFIANQERIHRSMECYLASYKDDGMCVEGVGYWTFGFGFFASFALLEREFTNGEVNWFENPKVKEISKFLQKTFLQRDVLLTFSDSSVKQRYFLGVPHMLRYVYGDEIEALPSTLANVVWDNTHFNFALRGFIYYDTSAVSDQINQNVTYSVQNSAYFFKRTPYYGFAVKGGNNGESHNHIDVGSFILARDNKQIICDIGAGPYEDGYHTEKRYTHFNPSAYAHSIPMIDGVGEDDIRRDDVIAQYDEENNCVTLDFTTTYSDAIRSEKLSSAVRKFTLDNDRITLLDSFELKKSVKITERFVSIVEPTVTENGVMIDDVLLSTRDSIAPTVSYRDVRYHNQAGTYRVYMIDYDTDKSDFEITFIMGK